MDAQSTVRSVPLFVATNIATSPSIRLTLAALACCFAGLLSLAIDMPASRWLRTRPAGDGVAKLLAISESFSHGAGVALILVSVGVLDARSRRKLPRAAVIAFGAGLLANIGKLALARSRPKAFAGDGAVWETFQGWLPWLTGGDEHRWTSQLQSFPSAHAATGFGLAIALTWLYPHGRWLFLALATLAALQRVDAGAHYPSDIWFGAAIACLAGAAFLGNHSLTRRFARWETPPAGLAGR